jgi:hypothetical protein
VIAVSSKGRNRVGVSPPNLRTETDPVSIKLWSSVFFWVRWTKSMKPVIHECYMPSLKPFRINILYIKKSYTTQYALKAKKHITSREVLIWRNMKALSRQQRICLRTYPGHEGESFLWSQQLLSYLRNSQYFMYPDSSLQCSQDSVAGPYPKPDESRPLLPSYFSKIHFSIILPSTSSLSPKVKRPGREADHSPPTSAEVKKMWIYTSTSHTPSWRSA